MTIEEGFDVSFIAGMALREKQIQQNYRPVIGVHKWFARRPGTLFRGLVLAEFGDDALKDCFFQGNDLSGIRIADPFMGGGTPLIEANRVGCDVQGFDVNPMSAWIVREEVEDLDVPAYEAAARALVDTLRSDLGRYYRTTCPHYGDADVPVKSFLWVKVLPCESCGNRFDLFPGYLLAENRRHPRNVLVCPSCGDLNEVEDRRDPGSCAACGAALRRDGPARRGRCDCPHCGHFNVYPGKGGRPLDHRMFAIEYHNPERKSEHRGRFFKKPDADDLARMEAAAERWGRLRPRFVPDDGIPSGDETNRLHRWGYARYRDMFNPRQLLGLESSCRLISGIGDDRIRRALATNLSDLLRYQNMLCRYDTMALKSLDIFSVHGFPVGLVQCESNLLGIAGGAGMNVGSGGWSNIIAKYAKAKRYCRAPYEFRRNGTRNVRVAIEGERIGEKLHGKRREVVIRCASATEIELAPGSLDGVFTDPPYFGNVQYGELMDFCYVWLRRLEGREAEGFERSSSRSPHELTGNLTQERGLDHFTEGLSAVYSRMARALKPGSPFVFTWRHNRLEAYYAVGAALLDAGLVCSASLPCPAEMGGSIHIHGTSSSIIDTVFVCRTAGTVPRSSLFDAPEQLARIVAEDLVKLENAGRKPTPGDVRCVVFGHLTRMGVWKLRKCWNGALSTERKLAGFADAVSGFGDPDYLLTLVESAGIGSTPAGPRFAAFTADEEVRDDVSFQGGFRPAASESGGSRRLSTETGSLPLDTPLNDFWVQGVRTRAAAVPP